jgi:hypothetical protein
VAWVFLPNFRKSLVNTLSNFCVPSRSGEFLKQFADYYLLKDLLREVGGYNPPFFLSLNEGRGNKREAS